MSAAAPAPQPESQPESRPGAGPASGWRFCPQCAGPLALLAREEDGGPRTRLRCAACGFTHWNNPTPVLAAVIEMADRGGQILLARNAAWSGRLFALITGFMEAGETPEEGVRREIVEETSVTVETVDLIGVYDFQRMNQIIVAYHAVARGEIRLSPELAEYKLFEPATLKCWNGGTGDALFDWLRSKGHTPQRWSLPPAGSGSGN